MAFTCYSLLAFMVIYQHGMCTLLVCRGMTIYLLLLVKKSFVLWAHGSQKVHNCCSLLSCL
jgi:hypothetical protein